MNQTNSDLDPKENGSKIFGGRISNFINVLELFVVLVNMGVAFIIILLGVFSNSKILQMTNLLTYLTIASLFLVIYSLATTRTVKASITYKLKQVIKRFIDILFAFLMLNVLSPLILLLAFAVRIESSGPVFFYSIRLGQFGKPFRVLKFRTMHLGSIGGFTRVGSFLRRTYLNELPQLWNVLMGEMSLVGPRPRRPESLGVTLDSQGKILTVKPGLTGLSQISEASDKELINSDLEYVQNWSLSLDIKILFKTFLVAFQDGKSA